MSKNKKRLVVQTAEVEQNETATIEVQNPNEPVAIETTILSKAEQDESEANEPEHKLEIKPSEMFVTTIPINLEPVKEISAVEQLKNPEFEALKRELETIKLEKERIENEALKLSFENRFLNEKVEKLEKAKAKRSEYLEISIDSLTIASSQESFEGGTVKAVVDVEKTSKLQQNIKEAIAKKGLHHTSCDTVFTIENQTYLIAIYNKSIERKRYPKNSEFSSEDGKIYEGETGLQS